MQPADANVIHAKTHFNLYDRFNLLLDYIVGHNASSVQGNPSIRSAYYYVHCNGPKYLNAAANVKYLTRRNARDLPSPSRSSLLILAATAFKMDQYIPIQASMAPVLIGQ